jgi:NAD(P)H-nitrite reductase large subunit
VYYGNSEKVLKLDAKRREYDINVIGEEPHLAYNRVGLTSFFRHRKVESLYLNQQDWVSRSKNEVRVVLFNLTELAR